MVTPESSSRGPVFPYWPFNALSLYIHMAQDFGRCAHALTGCASAAEAARTEGDFGLRLFGDLMQGYYDLALAPWTAMASVMAQQGKPTPAPIAAAEAEPPLRSRRRAS
jgi:hypothetical protein